MKIPFLDLSHMHSAVRNEMLESFQSVYDSNWFVLGRCVENFEGKYAGFNQVKHAIGTSNGLDALFLALKALGIGNGDEVIVPSNTYIASLLAISYTGATPVLVEPNEATFNIDPHKISDAITQETKAIMPVHLFGQACEMDVIEKIGAQQNLHIIEDNAQAHSASFKGRKTGTWGILNATSFYPGKNLGALGDGGAVTTDSDTMAKRVRMLRNYGSEQKYYHEVAGFNMRLDEMQAAFLSVKLEHILTWTRERQEIAGWYNDSLQYIGDLVLPFTHPESTHVYHLYVVRTQFRDELQKHLSNQGIGTLIHYPVPPHLQKAYSTLGYNKGDFPIAEEMATTSLSLPLWPGMTQQHVEQVASEIADFFHKNRPQA
jgi:dTDP-4-amino-4,6-dideoxygalactose transaminase